MIKHKRPHSIFALGNINLQEATGIETAEWEPFQIVLLNDDSKLSIWRKSRQVAFSFSAALEAVIDALLYDQGSIFVSINLDEAKEKIRYARAIYKAVHSFPKQKLIRDNEMSLEFEGGARIESLPGKAPRGKAKRNVYLDEFAHVQKDRNVYKGALPVISKGGRLRIGSSTMGAGGLFWEIDTESIQPYSGYSRFFVPWWHVTAFCTDVGLAREIAPMMSTDVRVERFGNDVIKMIFENMPLEDFQQEYEGLYVDEVHAWIPWDEIKAVQDPDLDFRAVKCRGGNVQEALEAIAELERKISAGQVEKVVGVGVDIGRKRNATEVFIGGTSTTESYPLRLSLTLEGMPFRQQEDLLRHILQQLPVLQMLIDQNGIGMNLAENLQDDFPVKVVPAEFNNANKKLWSTDAKMLIQKQKTPLPADRDIGYQIHSIKRIISSSNNLIFDTDGNEKHHADKYWAWALMLCANLGRMSSDKHVVEGSAAFGIR